MEFGTIPIKYNWGTNENKSSTKTINAGEGWIGNGEEIDNFYLTGNKTITYDGKLWALPAIALGGDGCYRVNEELGVSFMTASK